MQQNRTEGLSSPPCSIIHSATLIEGIDNALLLSAYDIHYSLLSDCSSLISGFTRSRYAIPRLLIIDSGWYEKETAHSGTTFVEGLQNPKPWSAADYRGTLDSLDHDLCAIAVSWDSVGSYDEQIRFAQDFLGSERRLGTTILLKRPNELRFHDLNKLSGDNIANLRAFDIVGVTEKELGETVLNRLLTLAQLRTRLDEQAITAPIHVFGGLDPLFTPLYFAAGGEIFDGLGWLRYFYHDGHAINRESAAFLNRWIGTRWMQMMTKVAIANLDSIRDLEGELRLVVHHDGDWSRLRRGDELKHTLEQFEERLEKRRGW